MVFCSVLANTHWSFGWKLVHVIGLSKMSNLTISFLFSASQTINFLSSPPEQTRLISWLILALLTQLLWPIKEPLNFKVSISHNLTLLSSLAVKIDLPSDEKSTDLTAAVWPLMVLVLILVAGYHNLTVVSFEALASMF